MDDSDVSSDLHAVSSAASAEQCRFPPCSAKPPNKRFKAPLFYAQHEWSSHAEHTWLGRLRAAYGGDIDCCFKCNRVFGATQFLHHVYDEVPESERFHHQGFNDGFRNTMQRLCIECQLSFN